ncbi:hypothetical protein KR026_000788, partial [Drosophila bipectinata]
LDTDASSNYSLWRITKWYKDQPTPKSAKRNPSGGWCRTSLEKAEVFANNLEQRFKPYEYSPDSIRRQVEEFLESPFQMSLPANPVSLTEVKDLVGKLSPKKTPGEDLLDNRTIRLLPDQALQFLVTLFNSILTVGYFPKVWISANIHMIPKPGKSPTDVDSYRPISSVLGPTLYSIYASDMPTKTPITEVNEQDVLIATYADDTAVLTKSSSILAATFALQEYLDAFHQWATNWNIRVNADKCANVTFT